MTDIYDLEVMRDLFIYCGLDKDTKKMETFIVHRDRDNSAQFVSHLRKLKGQIGYNNHSYDYSVLHHLLAVIKNHKDDDTLGAMIIHEAYKKSEEIIGTERYRGIPVYAHLIPQLDLFKMWHFDNENRRTSLKAVSISMNWPLIEESPIPFDQYSTTLEEAEQVARYCQNDVLITHELYLKSEEKLKLRRKVREKYGFKHCLSWSDSKIGEQIMLDAYCRKTRNDPRDVKTWRTHHNSLPLKDAIKGYVKFESDTFNNALAQTKNKVLANMDEKFQLRVVYKQFAYYIGVGGIHGCIESNVYHSDDEWVIVDADVASQYPQLGVVNRMYPLHLGEIFCDVYKKDIVDPRIMAKANKDFTMADGFKLGANTVYGKSNSEHSFLYDPMYTLGVTMTGQFQLLMLSEMLTSSINDLMVLQINTDGITVKIRRNALPVYEEVCHAWEQLTNLTLEYAEYAKMAIADVNNYIALKYDGKTKEKGRYEVDKFVGKEPAYHKDNSFRIVPLSVRNYFSKGISVQQTIAEHTDIYDFLGRQKFERGASAQLHAIENGELRKYSTGRYLRYCISNEGYALIKQMNGRQTKLHYPYKVLPVMDANPFFDVGELDIDHSFYVKQALNEISMFEQKQTGLFQ